MSSLDKANVILARFKRHGIEPGTNYATVYDALMAMLDVADNAYNAGRAYQRDVDAGIAEKTVVGIDDNGLYNDPLEEVSKAIREQKILWVVQQQGDL